MRSEAKSRRMTGSKRIGKIGLVILVVGIMTLGYGGMCKKKSSSSSGSSAPPPPTIVILKNGSFGTGVDGPVLEDATVEIDEIEHSSEDTKSLKCTVGSSLHPSIAYLFNPIRDMTAYHTNGHIRFNVKSPKDLRIYWETAAKSNVKDLSTFGYAPDGTKFKSVAVKISILDANSYTDVITAFKIGTHDTGACTFWVDNIRWTAD